MIQNRFIIISTVYNKSKWVSFYVNSVKQQDYNNYLAVYGYDKSTDDSLFHLETSIDNHDQFIIYHNPNPSCFLNCFMGTYRYLKQNNLIQDSDIIVEVDGDDWLINSSVLQYLNEIYQNPNIWMTYGQYIQHPSGNVGWHYSVEIEDYVDDNNLYRESPFPFSHLKTFRSFLLNNVTDEDLTDPTTGKYFAAAADFALSMPLVEQAGKKRIFRVPEPLYVYNTSEDLESESNNRWDLQKQTELKIRKIPPKTKL